MGLSKRKLLQSVGFEQEQLQLLEKLIAVEGGSISEHTRNAVDAYLKAKGLLKTTK